MDIKDILYLIFEFDEILAIRHVFKINLNVLN